MFLSGNRESGSDIAETENKNMAKAEQLKQGVEELPAGFDPVLDGA